MVLNRIKGLTPQDFSEMNFVVIFLLCSLMKTFAMHLQHGNCRLSSGRWNCHSARSGKVRPIAVSARARRDTYFDDPLARTAWSDEQAKWPSYKGQNNNNFDEPDVEIKIHKIFADVETKNHNKLDEADADFKNHNKLDEAESLSDDNHPENIPFYRDTFHMNKVQICLEVLQSEGIDVKFLNETTLETVNQTRDPLLTIRLLKDFAFVRADKEIVEIAAVVPEEAAADTWSLGKGSISSLIPKIIEQHKYHDIFMKLQNVYGPNFSQTIETLRNNYTNSSKIIATLKDTEIVPYEEYLTIDEKSTFKVNSASRRNILFEWGYVPDLIRS
jgi:hypothetical protein